MSAIESVPPRTIKTPKNAIRAVVGGVLGAAIGYGTMRLALSLHVETKSLTWSDFLGYWLGVTFFGVGLVLYAISFNRRELAENIEGQAAKLPATDKEVYAYRLQAATLVCAGLMLILLLLARGTFGETRQSQWIVFASIVALFVAQTMANVLVWRASDEFLRIQILQTGATTFAIGQGALFLWAAAERLHLVKPVTSWEIVTVMLAIYLTTGSIIAVRNRPGC